MTLDQVWDMPAPQFRLFYAYHKRSPLGRERFDYLASLVASATTNVHLKKKDRVKPDFFMPKWKERKVRGKKARKVFDKAAKGRLFGWLDRQVKKGLRSGAEHTDN